MTLRRLLVFSIFVCTLALLPGCARSSSPGDLIYQVSPLSALMDGVYDGPTTLKKLASEGDLGLGTFNHLDGEMVLLDGQFYQVRSDGKVLRPSLSKGSPFASVTSFKPEISSKIKEPLDLADLTGRIDAMLPSPNLFYAIRIDGRFDEVRTRSVPAQELPYRRLAEVARDQSEFELGKVEGTVVGFRCPAWVGGLNVPGYHLHFLSKDRKTGGHLLRLRMLSGTIKIDQKSELNLSLDPTGGAGKQAVGQASEDEIHQIESAK